MSDRPGGAVTSGEGNATPMQVTRGSLVVSLQRVLEERQLRRLRRDLLEQIQSKGLRGVILDATAVETMDSVDFSALRRTLEMAALMGAIPIIVGLRPGIVSALVTMDVDIRGLRAAANLDRGLELLEELQATPE